MITTNEQTNEYEFDAKKNAEETLQMLNSIALSACDDDVNFPNEQAEDEESEDDEDDEDDEREWDLGFLEPINERLKMHSIFFPSKAGGCELALDPVAMSIIRNLTTLKYDFLLQVYAVNSEYAEDAFHRALYVYVDKRGDKVHLGNGCKCYRVQMKRENEFYSSEPIMNRIKESVASERLTERERELVERERKEFESRCERALKKYGGCYERDRDRECGHGRYAEFEIIVEPESDDDVASCSSVDSENLKNGTNAGNNGNSNSKNNAIRKTNADFKSIGDEQITERDLKEIERGVIDLDQQRLATFSLKLSRFPEQVLRYCPALGAKAMWPSKTKAPNDSVIPDCPKCGAKRKFEFQILPTIVSFIVPREDIELNDTTLDFGSIAIYTCSNSCALDVGEFAEEYCLVHAPLNN